LRVDGFAAATDIAAPGFATPKNGQRDNATIITAAVIRINFDFFQFFIVCLEEKNYNEIISISNHILCELLRIAKNNPFSYYH
jgi:hypothetical protein